MARQRKLSPERKAFIDGLLEHYQPTDTNDVQEMLKDLLGDTLQRMLEAEMDQNEYSCAMKSHFRKSGNQMSGKWKSSYASLLA